MKTVGLVVEYNPLHNGHRYHIEAAKAITGADSVVAVMSGDFLQRGEPALVSKWARAEMALAAGVDLVIELPVLFATANAEMFAHGAVSLLDRLGVVDAICFGSESGEIGWMLALAELLANEPRAFSDALKKGLSAGLAYPAADARATAELLNGTGFGTAPVEQPNNILGLNYLLSLKRLNSRMQPATIQRQKADYRQETITDARIASATALRKLLFEERADLDALAPYVPASTLSILKRECAAGRGPVSWEHFRHPLFHRLLQLSPSQLATIREMEEGIEHRLKQAVKTAASVSGLIAAVKTKRYTWTRLQRTLLYVLLDLRKETLAAMPLKQGARYARVLGFSEKGRQLLHAAKQKGALPLYSNVRDGLDPMLDLDIAAHQVYRLAAPGTDEGPFTEEYRRPPITFPLASAPSGS